MLLGAVGSVYFGSQGLLVVCLSSDSENVFCVLLSFYWSDGDKVVAFMSGDGLYSWNGYCQVV